MKKLFVLAFLFISFIFTTNAQQKLGYVDSEYILKSIPTYEAAMEQFNDISKKYQQEVDAAFEELKSLDLAYQKEEVLLSSDMKRKKQDEILEKEKYARELQKKYFGKDGELYKKRLDLVKPIQDEVFNTIQQLAQEGDYDFVIDSASGLIMLYSNPQYDLSDEVLKKMGYGN